MTIFAASTLLDRLSRWMPRSPLALYAATAVAAGVLSACGGGTQAEKFEPAKIVSFGDESSVLMAVEVASAASSPQYIHGQKYGVNYVTYLALPADARLPLPPASGASSVSVANAASNAANWGAYPAASAASISASVVSSNSGADLVSRVYQAALSIFYTDPIPTPTTKTLANGTVEFLYSHDCYEANKIWIQIVAAGFNKGYNPGTGAAADASGCLADSLGGAVTYAQPHALVSSSPVGMTVQSVRDQVTAHKGELDQNTLVTMLAGQNDVVAAYKKALADIVTTPGNATSIKAGAVSTMKDKGRELGQIINEIIRTGARVAFVTLPDLSGSPLVVNAGVNGDAALMQSLVEGFNTGLTGAGGAVNNGNQEATVQLFGEFRYRLQNPGLFGLINAPWCDKTKARAPDGSLVSASDPDVLLHCSSLSGLGAEADQSLYIWSDDINLGPAGHALLGSMAYSRIVDNPL